MKLSPAVRALFLALPALGFLPCAQATAVVTPAPTVNFTFNSGSTALSAFAGHTAPVRI